MARGSFRADVLIESLRRAHSGHRGTATRERYVLERIRVLVASGVRQTQGIKIVPSERAQSLVKSIDSGVELLPAVLKTLPVGYQGVGSA